MSVTEPENFVEHFIDSTGVISWRFFSSKYDYEFCEWDFSGSSEDEANGLFGILEAMDKEVYIADLTDLGASACRILVPDYSEVYPVEDLIWDNTNKALNYREDILNLHLLSTKALGKLVSRLEESQLDNYTDISTLIGIVFDENTVWGKLTIIELKILIYLAIGAHEEAIELVGEFLQFNDNTVQRGLFYQAVNAVLEVTLDEDLELENFIESFNRMYGTEVMKNVVGSVTGEVRFYGLTKTSMALEGIEPHLRLIESYMKLHQARKIKAKI
jgi:ribosomal protein S12 methylthiotransferase accessory factor